MEDCNVYVGTLDTFIEERETIKETGPYHGGSIDGKQNGPELGVWELDLRSQFPVLFVPQKEVREKIPHSETIEKCTGKYSNYTSKVNKLNLYLYSSIFFLHVLTKCWKTLAVCSGRGGIVCSVCNADQEPGFYKENQMTQCSACYGRGLIAHKDGSDTM